jgi:putative transposase
VARCTDERLMRELGMTGAVRGKKVITTLPGGQVGRAPDRLERDYVAKAPNCSWIGDFSRAKTWAGVVYIAFVVDTFSRRIVGSSAATVKAKVFVLDAVEMAIRQRDREQHLPSSTVRYTDLRQWHQVRRLAENEWCG